MVESQVGGLTKEDS